MKKNTDLFWDFSEVVTIGEAIRVLYLFIFSLIVLSLLGVTSFWLSGEAVWQEFAFNSLRLLCVSFVILGLVHFRRLQLAIYAALFLYGGLFAFIAWQGAGVHDASYLFFVLLVLVAGLFLGKKAAYLVAGLVSLLGLGLLAAEKQGWLVNLERQENGLAVWIGVSALFLVVASLISFASIFLEKAFKQAHLELDERIRAEAELRCLNDELEQRVSERTAELMASQERYRLITENISDVVWSMDLDLNLTYISPSVQEVIGYTAQEVLQMPVERLMPPGSFHHARQLLEKAIAASETTRTKFLNAGELEFLRKDGSTLWGEVRVNFLYDETGQRYGAVAMAREITARKRTEAALRESEAKFRGLVEQSSDAIYLSNEDGVMVEWNQAAEKNTGYSRADVIGKYAWDVHYWLLSPEGKEDLAAFENQRAAYQEAARTGKADWFNQLLDGELTRRDGTKMNFQQVLFSIPGQSGYMIASVTRDVTGQKQVEIREKRRQEMLENIVRIGKLIGKVSSLEICLQHIHTCVQKELGFDRVGIFLYDPLEQRVNGVCGTDNNGNMIDNSWYSRIADDQTNWQAILNDPRPHIIEDYEKTPLTTQYENDMKGVKQHVAVAAWAGEAPIAFITADNLISNRRFSQEQIDALELFAGYVGLAIQNARWNEQLEQRVAERTARLEEVVRELESTSYTIAHDLRSPARAIAGYSRLLQEMDTQWSDEVGRGYLERIRIAGLQMGTMVDSLLEFLRIGRVTLRPQKIEAQCLVEQLAVQIQALHVERDLEFSIGVLPACQADPRLLKQVWVHLLSNAIKFTRLKETARIEIGAGQLGASAYYFVRDNGIGFDMKYAGQLFGMFNRLHHPEDFEGTGVGLAIVQRILARHGGRIWAEAVEGQGATFFFTLGPE
jgi:PAS domain S-box-containing protein